MLCSKSEIEKRIQLLIDNEIHLCDPTGECFVRVADGSLIDNKSFNFWEWTSGIGLYGLMKYYMLSNNPEILEIIRNWFEINSV
nr:glycoside hydrolase family 88 protein [Coriobacterium glomerans]